MHDEFRDWAVLVEQTGAESYKIIAPLSETNWFAISKASLVQLGMPQKVGPAEPQSHDPENAPVLQGATFNCWLHDNPRTGEYSGANVLMQF